MYDPDLDEEEIISKSQVKREMNALQDLGKRLLEIDSTLLAKCQLPENLQDAIDVYKRLPNKNEARRRQLQFIGKIMRKVDTTLIESVLEQTKQNARLEQRKFHHLEELREELLAGNQHSLEKLISDYPALDIQHVRQLIRQAQREKKENKSPAAARKLFKYLRELD